MTNKFRRILMQLAISATVAIATPALAAGLVEGVSAATSTVAGANTILPDDTGGGSATLAAAPADSHVATHAPLRLSALAGEDDAAWADARSVHRNKR
ncbi:MAG TPA: hypothetical protein VHU87_14530 [Rhizomicrobium sp.]|jgi:hypothetical protein|nr:hypothetical protein [Rhizomicrobium sp.]